MKRTTLTIAILAATIASAAPALAEGPRASSNNTVSATAPHEYPAAAPATAALNYQWQYHYAGRHARYREGWVQER